MMKKWIALLLAMLMMVTLCACGADKADDDKDTGKGGDKNTATTTTVADDDTVTTTTTAATITGEIGYDEDLVATWYLYDMAMVLREDGTGDLYYGDEDGGLIEWFTSGNQMSLTKEGKTSIVTYVVNGSDLTLTYADGTVESWFC